MTKLYNQKKQIVLRRKLRHKMTRAEWLLWGAIRNKQINGYRFRRQFGIGKYVVDFYCPKLKLAIELDGDSHFEEKTKEYDQKREKELASFRIRIVRFTNQEIYNDLYRVIEDIKKLIPLPTSPYQGEEKT